MVLEETDELGIPLGIPDEFPYECSLDSPEESVLGSSTETESDEDELTQQLTRLNLGGTALFPSSFFKPECDRVMPSSPNSTLSRPRAWPRQVSVKAPETAPFTKDYDGWDGFLNYATDCAGEDAGVQMLNGGPPESTFSRNREVLHHPPSIGQVHMQLHKASCTGFHPLQREQLVNHQVEQASRWIAENAPTRARCVRPVAALPRPASPVLQADQSNVCNNGMRAVFLGGAGAERAGTGVFLPRRYDNNNKSSNKHLAANPPRKTNRPAVLIPAKVIHSLNLNFKEIGVHPQAQPFYNHNVGFAPSYDALMARRRAILAQQKRILKVEGGANQEIDLPQDWTY